MKSTQLYLNAVGIIILCLISGCQFVPKPDKNKAIIPSGSKVAVISFRDCILKDESRCTGSGALAASRVASVLNDPPTLLAVVINRPVGPDESLNDSDAAEYGTHMGYRYVVNGEVLDYHPALFEPLHAQRIGITLRVLSTTDSMVIESYGCHEKLDILTPIGSAIEYMTSDIRDRLEGIDLSAFQHFFWRGDKRCDESTVKNFDKAHGMK